MIKYLFVTFLIAVVLVGCKKVTESPSSLGLTDITAYYPMKVGSVFIYRMDSTTYLQTITTSHYLAKDSVVNTFIDTQGRTCYYIFRYLTDTLASQPYQYNQSYYVTYGSNKIEVLDANNRRFIPLVNPVSYNTTWDGNSNFDTDSTLESISQSTSYVGWTYQYTSINQPYTVIDSTFPNTTTILQNADSTALTFDPNFIYTYIYSTEVYAQGVGLIYKQCNAYTWQPPASPNAGYYEDGSFGITLNLVSYK